MFRCISIPLGGQGTCAVLKSLVDEFETADGTPLTALPVEERLKYEKDPFYKSRDPRLFCTVMVPGDKTSISNYTYEPFKESSGDYIGKTGAVRSEYMMKKFLSERERATGRGTLDYLLYRYAEVLLTYVECLVESGDWQNTDVEKYINQIRNRADMPSMDKTIYNSQEKNAVVKRFCLRSLLRNPPLKVFNLAIIPFCGYCPRVGMSVLLRYQI